LGMRSRGRRGRPGRKDATFGGLNDGWVAVREHRGKLLEKGGFGSKNLDPKG